MRAPLTNVGSAFILFIFILITTVVVALLTTTFLVALFATPLLAIIAALLAAALVPDGVRHHVQSLDWSHRIVACDDQLATYRTFFGSFVSNDDA